MTRPGRTESPAEADLPSRAAPYPATSTEMEDPPAAPAGPSGTRRWLFTEDRSMLGKRQADSQSRLLRGTEAASPVEAETLQSGSADRIEQEHSGKV